MTFEEAVFPPLLKLLLLLSLLVTTLFSTLTSPTETSSFLLLSQLYDPPSLFSSLFLEYLVLHNERALTLPLTPSILLTFIDLSLSVPPPLLKGASSKSREYSLSSSSAEGIILAFFSFFPSSFLSVQVLYFVLFFLFVFFVCIFILSFLLIVSWYWISLKAPSREGLRKRSPL